MAERLLDCMGLRCPLPIVRISQAISAMPVGGRLRVEADDPAFRMDIEAWARRTGQALLELEDGPPHRAVIEKLE